jgi:hypothetical protein
MLRVLRCWRCRFNCFNRFENINWLLVGMTNPTRSQFCWWAFENFLILNAKRLILNTKVVYAIPLIPLFFPLHIQIKHRYIYREKYAVPPTTYFRCLCACGN